MAKIVEPPIRAISIFVGIMIGCILAYIYQVNCEHATLFYEMNVASLVVFFTIPMLVGFVSALLHPAFAMKNGLYAGFFSGLFNSVLATIKLIYTPPALIMSNEFNAFPLLAIMSVFTWMILASAAAVLAQKFYE